MSDILLALISDQKLVREGLKMICHQWPGYIVMEECDWSSASVERLKMLGISVVIIDLDGVIEMEGPRSVLQQIGTVARVVAIWSEGRKDVIWHLKIDGYHSKHCDSSELRMLVEMIATGKRKKAISGNEPFPANAGITELLGARELQICTLIAHGYTSREIAEHFALSLKTVEVHRHNILKKLGLSRTIHLVQHLTTG